MRNSVMILMFALVLASCKSNGQETEVQEVTKSDIAYVSFGDKITDANVMDTKQMSDKFMTMAVGDTINTKMSTKVIEVCQNKGCWMKVNLENGEEAMVKFKDYGFFMPKDIAGKDVILNGKAYVTELPVDEQRHYAEDAGKSAEEIAAITEPKKTYSFEADGVLIKQ